MKISLKKGRYVIAVSGGVDSVVLLDLLSREKNLRLHVAHFDHGIRLDSAKDRKLVEELAKKYNLPFYFEEGKLGPKTSEAGARKKRHEFLESIKKETGSDAIITAHHQDDLIETASINILRGTSRKGLSSLRSTEDIKRPLLDFSKEEITAYAKKNDLKWHEDPTNRDEKYLRNWVRHNLLRAMSNEQRAEILRIIKETGATNQKIDEVLSEFLPKIEGIDQSWFVSLPHAVAREVLAGFLRSNFLSIDKKTVERLVVGLKTSRDHAKLDINKNRQFMISERKIYLIEV